MKPLDLAFQIIEKGRKPIGTIHEVSTDDRGVVVRFTLFPEWEIDDNGFLRNKNREDTSSNHDDGTMDRYTMHG